LALLAGACIAPPNRPPKEDQIAEKSTVQLQPKPRPSADSTRPGGDAKSPSLEDHVSLLSSELPLERMQAQTRLRAAGQPGILATARFVAKPDGAPVALVEALRFIEDADLSQLDAESLELVRAALADRLKHEHAGVRIRAARALQVHGAGSQRTAFLQAIADPERRVRWAVVRRFGDQPEELKQAQRDVLLSLLRVRAADGFQTADIDQDGKLARAEFTGSDDEFRSLDHDGDGVISQQDWLAGRPSAVRADVIELLLRLHSKHTPADKPPGYNPYAPAAAQQAAVQQWTEWSSALPE
jgi:hypothetical protein